MRTVVVGVVVENRSVAEWRRSYYMAPETPEAGGDLVGRNVVTAGSDPVDDSHGGQSKGEHDDVEDDVVTGRDCRGDEIDL